MKLLQEEQQKGGGEGTGGEELGWALQVTERVQARGGIHPKERFQLCRVPPGKLMGQRDHLLAGPSVLRRSPCAGDFMLIVKL